MGLPGSASREVLSKTNPLFKADRLALYDAMYQGGSKADAVKAKILVRRKLEKRNEEIFQARLERSDYIPHGAVLDFLCAAVFLDEPHFEGTKYFQGLNDDCDGSGLDLGALARQILLETFLHGDAPGAYLALDFDVERGDYSKPDTLDARWRLLPAAVVDDWGPDWIRIHTVRVERTDPMDAGRTVERWVYVTADEIAEYVSTDPAAETVPGTVTAHTFGRCPVFRIRLSNAGMWVMDRIAPILRAMFNRESAVTFALDFGCFSVPVLKRAGVSKELICSETNAVKLLPGEDFSFAAPNPGAYQPGFDDLERLRTELARSIHGLALEAAAKTQAPRAGAFATAMQRGPLDAMLMSFAAPVRDVLECASRAVAEYRKEPAPVLKGFERFDASLDDLAEAVGQGANPGAKSRTQGSGAPADSAPPVVKES
jgi:hypothetical protein